MKLSRQTLSLYISLGGLFDFKVSVDKLIQILKSCIALVHTKDFLLSHSLGMGWTDRARDGIVDILITLVLIR